VNHVVRSTSVPIAARFKPMMRSPCQWPGPMARHSPISGFGRTLADHDLRRDEGFAAALAAGAGEPKSARPVRRQAVSSRRSAPRPWI
jgi:hypothetical protein